MKKNTFNYPLLVIGIILCLSVLFFAIYSTKSGILYVTTDGNPADTVTSFYDAMISGNYDEAYTYLKDYQSLGMDGSYSDEYSEQIYSLLTSNYSYELIDKPTISDFTASQQVAFTYIDVQEIDEEISKYIEPILESKVESMSRHELYDDNGNYKSSLLDEVYREAFFTALSNPSIFLTTVTYDANLEYINGSWLLLVNDDMVNSFAGGL